MISHQWGPGFLELIPERIGFGERLVATSECYAIHWDTKTVVNNGVAETTQQMVIEPWMGVALTSLNLRFFQWAQSAPRGLMRKLYSMAMQPIITPPFPEIVSEHTLPLNGISTYRVSRVRPPGPQLGTLKTIFKTDPGDVAVLEVQTAGIVYEFFSPYSDFYELTQKLSAQMTGAALGHQTSVATVALSRLAALRAEGVLTDEEFDRAKAGLLGADVEVAESSASVLRQLYALYRAGVLTESEFRMKKWDVLSRSR